MWLWDPPEIRRGMINNQRLGYQRLAEVLVERGLVEAQAVQDALSMGAHGGLPFPEALVAANLVADWELSRVVSELHGLPFLTVDVVDPDPKARRGLDTGFLVENCLVPLSRYGQVLTLCMPAIVPAEVLGLMAAESDLLILPVVGTVRTNRRWLDDNLAPNSAMPVEEGEVEPAEDSNWSSIFDDADAQVLQELGGIGPLESESLDGGETGTNVLDISDLDAGALETGELEAGSIDSTGLEKDS